MRTFVIAEAAATHDGSLAKAIALVHLAADIGADAVKFQWLSRAERLCERRNAPEYLDAYRLLQFSEAWFPDLAAICTARGIEFLTTCYLPEDISVVARYVKRFKVSSFEATDPYFVALHAEWPEKQLIISAGMGADLRLALTAYGDGMRGDTASASVRWRALHCVSAYPCPAEQIGLDALRSNASHQWYQRRHGLSDHTRHPWTGALAVAAGAEIIEFHVRLDDTAPANADFTVARDPAEALEYVAHVREAEAMMGSGQPMIQPAEEPMVRYRVGNAS